MNANEIKEILALHEKWLKGLADGRGANLRGADLGGANLRGANLWEADLRGANLRGADLGGANLGGANLGGANLRGANLWEADLRGANLGGANLRGANLWEADLRGANLGEADLRGANLRGANLWGADLRGANLWEADLRGANLRGADLLPDLYILKFQPADTKLRAWKFLHADGISPYQSHRYEVGKSYSTVDFSTDERITCDRGLNVATLQWCLRNSDGEDNLFIEVEFLAGDIVAVPFATDGKFRVKALNVLRQITKAEAKKIVDDVMEPYTTPDAIAEMEGRTP
jgi:uncharacterized protein YjbI with pentapeptide repeats